MLKIENVDVMGWEAAIRGMRNPMNSWEQSDSGWTTNGIGENDICIESDFEGWHELKIGPNDRDLMKRLCNAGTDHRKFMRMITVYLDITAPLYWWKEFDTYKVGTVANSCSTMHKIHDKEFTREDFSHEHLFDFMTGDVELLPIEILDYTINCLNLCRERYLKTNDKEYWWQMIQLLPSSYNQRRTVMLNYEVLANIYKSRRNHKLDEWHTLCDWIKTLPYSELITGIFDESDADKDVVSTEAPFDHLEPTDFLAREILADLAGMPVDTKINDLTAKIIFGSDKKHTQNDV